MKIERIVKKDSKNVVIHFDNNEKLFLSYEVTLKNNLRKNNEVDQKYCDYLVEENRRYFVKESALRYLSRRIHSVRELKLKLLQKKYEQRIIENVIEELIAKGFLDDYKFASEYSEQQILIKKWGKEKLKSELFKKGISREIIEQVLNENLSDENSFDYAKQIAVKKYNILSKREIDEKKLKGKLLTFLISKGYDYEISKGVIDGILKDNEK